MQSDAHIYADNSGYVKSRPQERFGQIQIEPTVGNLIRVLNAAMACSVDVHCNVKPASGTRANQIESAYAREILCSA